MCHISALRNLLALKKNLAFFPYLFTSVNVVEVCGAEMTL